MGTDASRADMRRYLGVSFLICCRVFQCANPFCADPIVSEHVFPSFSASAGKSACYSSYAALSCSLCMTPSRVCNTSWFLWVSRFCPCGLCCAQTEGFPFLIHGGD